MIKNTIRRQLANCAPLSNVGRRYAHTPVPFNWEDPLDSSNLYTEEELAIQETARSYCQERMLPRVLGTFDLPQTLGIPPLTPHLPQTPIEKKNMTAKS